MITKVRESSPIEYASDDEYVAWVQTNVKPGMEVTICGSCFQGKIIGRNGGVHFEIDANNSNGHKQWYPSMAYGADFSVKNGPVFRRGE